MNFKFLSRLTAACCMLITTANAQTIVGFDFASSNLIPETLDSHLVVQNQSAVTALSFPAPIAVLPPDSTLMRIDADGNAPMVFSFDVVIESGYELNLTGLFIGVEAQKTPGGLTSALYYNTGSGNTIIASTEHTAQDVDVGSRYADYSDNTITVSGLTGTVTFSYIIGSANPGIDYYYADEFNLIGSVTAIPEPGAYALLAGSLGLVAIVLRRRKR